MTIVPMTCHLAICLAIIFAAGVLGGLVNAVMTGDGLWLPGFVEVNGTKYLRPGILGNIVVSGVAAVVSWGLYGPFGDAYIYGGPSEPAPKPYGVTLAAFTGAIIVGIGGARWLTNEVDKKLLRLSAAVAMTKQPSPAVAAEIMTATPADALDKIKRAP